MALLDWSTKYGHILKFQLTYIVFYKSTETSYVHLSILYAVIKVSKFLLNILSQDLEYLLKNICLEVWLWYIISVKGRYTPGNLFPHQAPATRSRSKAPSSAPTISREKNMLRNKIFAPEFCSRVLLPHIKLVWYEGVSSRGKSVARVCFRSKLPRVYWNLLAVKWRVSSWPIKLAYFFHPQLIANSLSKWRPKK